MTMASYIDAYLVFLIDRCTFKNWEVNGEVYSAYNFKVQELFGHTKHFALGGNGDLKVRGFSDGSLRLAGKSRSIRRLTKKSRCQDENSRR